MAHDQTELTSKKCLPCEGGVEACSLDEARSFLNQVAGWAISSDGKKIHREWKFKNFMEGMGFLNRVAQLAEDEGHHPDIHLTNYRIVGIEIWTHAVGGLTENDFILAAKINGITAN